MLAEVTYCNFKVTKFHTSTIKFSISPLPKFPQQKTLMLMIIYLLLTKNYLFMYKYNTAWLKNKRNIYFMDNCTLNVFLSCFLSLSLSCAICLLARRRWRRCPPSPAGPRACRTPGWSPASSQSPGRHSGWCGRDAVRRRGRKTNHFIEEHRGMSEKLLHSASVTNSDRHIQNETNSSGKNSSLVKTQIRFTFQVYPSS